MTQEKADEIFSSSLGSQLDLIYVTSDDKPFIRFEEADKHRQGKLDPAYPNPLADQTITEWIPSWDMEEQPITSITSVDNLHLHTDKDGNKLSDQI